MTSRSARQSEPAVAVGSSQRTWVAELMSYAQDHAGVRVVGTVLSAREAVEQAYDVLLIDDSTSYLTKRLIDRVQVLRRLVIGVYESTRGDVGRDKLLELGVDAVIDADSSPKEFMARIRYMTEQRLVDRDFAEMVSREADDAAEAETPAAEPQQFGPARSLVVVSGSGGVTEVAVGLAAELNRRRQPVVLADFDTLEPTVAQRLDVALSPNVLTAIESLRHTGRIDGALVTHDAGFSVVPGLPSPREWEACGAEDSADLASTLGHRHSNVIVKVNRHLEDLSPFGGRTGRFGVSRRFVADADHLVVVGDPSPTGVTALLAWIGDARALSSAPIHVVLNHSGKSLYQQGEVKEEIRRTFRSATVVFVPEEHKVRKASWQGELPPEGRFTRALETVASRVAAVPASLGGL
jgi:MinD-like ATPase involved in chromosome partitioning or flagellar assembly